MPRLSGDIYDPHRTSFELPPNSIVDVWLAQRAPAPTSYTRNFLGAEDRTVGPRDLAITAYGPEKLAATRRIADKLRCS
jgi:hypothetical protein